MDACIVIVIRNIRLFAQVKITHWHLSLFFCKFSDVLFNLCGYNIKFKLIVCNFYDFNNIFRCKIVFDYKTSAIIYKLLMFVRV